MATIPTDPLFANQWHLQNNTDGLLDLNIVDVWDDYTGAGVEVAIIDDAVQRTHPDLEGNYSTLKDWDFEDDDTDASPSQNGLDSEGRPLDSHGTAVAGIVGAEANNGEGGVGVAYGSTIFGFKGFGNVTDAINSASGQDMSNGDKTADIVNMSFGTRGDYFFDQDLFGQDLNLSALNTAIDNAVSSGRNELGTILVKAAGNSRLEWQQNPRTGEWQQVDQDTNASSWNANPHTISVAAVDQDGFVSSYSTHGASLLVSAFGTPGEVVTTDRIDDETDWTDDQGDSNGNYNFGFNGTSAAAPMVSGVVALMLEANPDLGWRDVQKILAYSARHVGSDVGDGVGGDEQYTWAFNGATNWNGGGLNFSNDYGFGLVDAKAAVRLAETWGDNSQTSANQLTVSADNLVSEPTTIPFEEDEDTGELIPTVFDTTINDELSIEHVEVDIRFTEWDDLGDLKVRLTSPDNTTSILIDNSGENDDSAAGGFGNGRWEFFSNAFWGENTDGTWTVELFDADSDTTSPITIDDIDITFYGQSVSPDETFIFTEEYSDYDEQSGHARTINGGTGTDTINAAAVDENTTINLATGQGSIDGVAVTITDIENVFTGDGDDVITGNDSNNHLLGARGNDVLEGYSGNDSLYGGDGGDEIYGGDGNDTLSGGFGIDSFDGGNGNDTVDYSYSTNDLDIDLISGEATSSYAPSEQLVSIENIIGSQGDNILIGNDLDNVLDGGAGNDTLSGGDGIDSFDGGDDIDTVDLSSEIASVTAILQNQQLITTDAAGNSIYEDIRNVENLIGTEFSDRFTGDAESNEFKGEQGNDTLIGGGGDDILIGGEGNDWIKGGAGVDYLDGGEGRDIVDFRAEASGIEANLILETATYTDVTGNRVTEEMLGFERILGSQFNDKLTGNNYDNGLTGGGGDDILEGGKGNDWIRGDAGDDYLDGGEGYDTVDFRGEASGIEANLILETAIHTDVNGDQVTEEMLGFERILGSQFNDTLIGNGDGNNLTGGGGNDTLIGIGGNDILRGDAGADTFVLSSSNNGSLRIADFSSTAGDKIAVSAEIFGNDLEIGTLSADKFVLGSTAQDESDRFIYDTALSRLFFDADGIGGSSQVQIARLWNAPSLNYTDFNVID